MQDFVFGKMKAQEAAPEPYMLYNKEQTVGNANQKNETLRDFEYFRSMYPARVKELQLLVAKECDGIDYEGSPIYDEYPDRLVIEELCRKVQERVAARPREAVSPQTETMLMERETVETYEAAPSAEETVPRMPYGPEYIVQSVSPENGTYQTWEMEEGRPEFLRKMTADTQKEEMTETAEVKEEAASEQIQEAGQMRRPGPPPPPPRPWGPPPPPPRPWGPPPPPPRPWGPPPPPRPWGPPPPPPRPWGPPPPPPRPGDRVDLDDIIRLLLFNEIQGRRCRGRNCR